MNPFGRSAPIGAEGCCDNYAKSEINPRHLWNEHDSTRWYTDPEGWADHEANCKECGPERVDCPDCAGQGTSVEADRILLCSRCSATGEIEEESGRGQFWL